MELVGQSEKGAPCVQANAGQTGTAQAVTVQPRLPDAVTGAPLEFTP